MHKRARFKSSLVLAKIKKQKGFYIGRTCSGELHNKYSPRSYTLIVASTTQVTIVS